MTDDYVKDRPVISSYRRYQTNKNNSSGASTGAGQSSWLHSKFANTLKVINKSMPEDFKPKQAFVLGSGLGSFVDSIYVVERISYKKLEKFLNKRRGKRVW